MLSSDEATSRVSEATRKPYAFPPPVPGARRFDPTVFEISEFGLVTRRSLVITAPCVFISR